jgi:5-hydroxyisourate hydrolase
MSGLSTHVLDTALGRPGHGIKLRLYRATDAPTLLSSHTTNADGRTDEPLLSADNFALGTYEIVFEVADYFRTAHANTSEPPFLDEVRLRFTLTEQSHYHVPLLLSPWSYSTYRGS